MGLDPALQPTSDLTGISSFSDLQPGEGGAYFFDFDGVLSSRVEDDLYRLTISEADKTLIGEAARYFGILCQGMDWGYQRHLVYQAAACKINKPIEPGPALKFALGVAPEVPVFILTARSGWFAVERFRRFLADWRLQPLETFHVGRVKKDRQIALVQQELPEATIIYLEDNLSHLQAVQQAGLERVKSVLVSDEREPQPPHLLHNLFNTVVTCAIREQSALAHGNDAATSS